MGTIKGVLLDRFINLRSIQTIYKDFFTKNLFKKTQVFLLLWNKDPEDVLWT